MLTHLGEAAPACISVQSSLGTETATVSEPRGRTVTATAIMSGVAKEYSSSASPLHRYLFEHMTPLNPHMVKLRAASLEDPRGGMLGTSDELNFLQLLLGTLGARKTLDIGVFTGYRQVFFRVPLSCAGNAVCSTAYPIKYLSNPFLNINLVREYK